MATPEPAVESATLDASALLGYITGDPDFAVLKSLMAAVDRGDVRLVESTTVLVEVLPEHPRDSSEHRAAREEARALLESPRTQLVDVSTVVARKAGQLAAELGLKTIDAIHLATAILAGVNVLVVRDHRLPPGEYQGVRVTLPFDLDGDKLFGGVGEDLPG